MALRAAWPMLRAAAAGESSEFIKQMPIGSIFGKSDATTAALESGDEQTLEMISAVRRGRMDLALKAARPLAAERGEAPAQLLANECSDRAFIAFMDGAEQRQRGLQLAIAGSTFTLPLRGAFKPVDLDRGFWLQDVSRQYGHADAIAKLCRASLALRGLELPGAMEELQERSDADDEAAGETAGIAARDCRILGCSVVTRLQTSRSSAVVQAYIGNVFGKDASAPVRMPALFRLMMKVGKRFQDDLSIPDPAGAAELDDPKMRHLCLPIHRWVEQRQSATTFQWRIIAELVSEASTSLFEDKEDGLALLDIAAVTFREECAVAERNKALAVFKRTAEMIRDR